MGILKVIKFIVHMLSEICYLLILLYALVCVPIIFNYKPLVVLSGSMEPTYKVGSVIYYHPVDENELKEGDAITFTYENGDYITHRINSIIDNLYETKGDANNSPDVKKISYKDIKGKVAKMSIPYIGYYISFINTHLYLLIIVIIILISEFLLGSVKAFDIDKKDRKEGSRI